MILLPLLSEKKNRIYRIDLSKDRKLYLKRATLTSAYYYYHYYYYYTMINHIEPTWTKIKFCPSLTRGGISSL